MGICFLNKEYDTRNNYNWNNNILGIFNNYKIMENLIYNQIAEDYSQQFDNILIKGLSLKGFTFQTKSELEDFIKTNCQCIDEPFKEIKTFYVKGEPFLVYDYSIDTCIDYNKYNTTIMLGKITYV